MFQFYHKKKKKEGKKSVKTLWKFKNFFIFLNYTHKSNYQ